MRLDELFCDRESEASAARLGRLIEAIEDPRDPLGRDAGTGVANVDRHPRTLGACRHRYLAAARRVPKRVGDQVREDLASPDRIGVDLERSTRHLRLERHAGRQSPRCERIDRLAYERADVDRLAMERESARLGERQRAQILDEARQHLRLIEDRDEVRFVRGVNAIDERFEVALHHGQRRAELVAHVREKPAALLLARLETRGHRVERAREPARLARPSLRHPCGEIPVSDSPDSLDQVAHRAGDPAE